MHFFFKKNTNIKVLIYKNTLFKDISKNSYLLRSSFNIIKVTLIESQILKKFLLYMRPFYPFFNFITNRLK